MLAPLRRCANRTQRAWWRDVCAGQLLTAARGVLNRLCAAGLRFADRVALRCSQAMCGMRAWSTQAQDTALPWIRSLERFSHRDRARRAACRYAQRNQRRALGAHPGHHCASRYARPRRRTAASASASAQHGAARPGRRPAPLVTWVPTLRLQSGQVRYRAKPASNARRRRSPDRPPERARPAIAHAPAAHPPPLVTARPSPPPTACGSAHRPRRSRSCSSPGARWRWW